MAFIEYKTAGPKKTPLKSAGAKNTLKTRKPKNTDAKKKDAWLMNGRKAPKTVPKKGKNKMAL